MYEIKLFLKITTENLSVGAQNADHITLLVGLGVIQDKHVFTGDNHEAMVSLSHYYYEHQKNLETGSDQGGRLIFTSLSCVQSTDGTKEGLLRF